MEQRAAGAVERALVPFFNLGKPSEATLERFRAAQRAKTVTFWGALTPTPGFRFTQKRWLLGHGSAVFAKARSGLAAWAVYPAWLTLYPSRAPLREGVVLVLVAGVAPVWTLSAVRIVAVENTPQRFGFTLGTLPQHAVSGCERFSVLLDDHGQVWYEIAALSKPRQPLVKLGAPVLRGVQTRFAGDSVRSLKDFCSR